MKNPKIFLLIFLSLLLNTYSYSQDFWELMDSHKNVRSVDMSQDGTLYIAANDTLSQEIGVFKSGDDGISWNLMWSSPYNYAPVEIYCANNRVYFTMGELLVSDDEGQTWDTLYDGTSTIHRVLQGESGNIYFGAGALCRSVDNGQTWDTLLAPNPSVEFFYDIMEISPDTIYASSVNFLTGGGVYRSVDGGENWECVLQNYGVTALEEASNGDIFAAGYGLFDQMQNQVMVSHNRGDTWEVVVSKIYFQIQDMTITPDDEIYLGAIGVLYDNVGIYFSDDYGENWSRIESDIITNTSEIHVIRALPDGKLYTCVDSYTGITKRGQKKAPIK
ncbi:MAG: hypothetical protein U9R32_09275 [Bacteroidota bacterium]|nr:hypothetical protein [Bacteroidota bacterium]